MRKALEKIKGITSDRKACVMNPMWVINYIDNLATEALEKEDTDIEVVCIMGPCSACGEVHNLKLGCPKIVIGGKP